MFVAAAITSVQKIVSEKREMEMRNRPPVHQTINDIFSKVKKADEDAASIQPGDLAIMENGTNAMKSALDFGNLDAICTLVGIDRETLTAPCSEVSTPLQYLRGTPHPHEAKLIPLIEGLLLERGMIPFANGTAVDVDIVLFVLADRSEESLKSMLREGKIDFKQFKTLRELQSLPIGIEKQNENLGFLIECALQRFNPDEHVPEDDQEGDDEQGGCVVS